MAYFQVIAMAKWRIIFLARNRLTCVFLVPGTAMYYNNTAIFFAPANNRKDAIAATEKRMKMAFGDYKIQ